MGSLVLLALVATGCATPTQQIAPLSPGYYDVRGGNRLDLGELREQLRTADYVLVGETHDSVADHQMQLLVYQTMLQDGPVAIGFEMFQRPFQPFLDEYVRGELDEEQMLERTEYDARWGFQVDFYSPLWIAAKESGSPIVALNVRRELTKRVSAVGLNNLTTHERADLPEIYEGPTEYAAWLRSIFEGHGMKLSPERFRRFFQAQLLWDETMADSAYRAQSAGSKRIMVVVGRGHVERGWGIPIRIQRRHPGAKIVTIVSISKFDSLSQAADNAVADFVVVQP